MDSTLPKTKVSTTREISPHRRVTRSQTERQCGDYGAEERRRTDLNMSPRKAQRTLSTRSPTRKVLSVAVALESSPPKQRVTRSRAARSQCVEPHTREKNTASSNACVIVKKPDKKSSPKKQLVTRNQIKTNEPMKTRIQPKRMAAVKSDVSKDSQD